MKKILCSVLALIMLAGLVSCGGKGSGADTTQNGSATTTESGTSTTGGTTSTDTSAPSTTNEKINDMSLEDILKAVYKDVENTPMVMNTEITKDNSEYYCGVKELDCKEALASEAMISAIAHSIVVIRVNDGTDIEALKKDIKEKVNPRKWVCVSVDDANVRVDSLGNVVILILDNENYDKYLANFNALGETK